MKIVTRLVGVRVRISNEILMIVNDDDSYKKYVKRLLTSHYYSLKYVLALKIKR